MYSVWFMHMARSSSRSGIVEWGMGLLGFYHEDDITQVFGEVPMLKNKNFCEVGQDLRGCCYHYLGQFDEVFKTLKQAYEKRESKAYVLISSFEGDGSYAKGELERLREEAKSKGLECAIAEIKLIIIPPIVKKSSYPREYLDV